MANVDHEKAKNASAPSLEEGKQTETIKQKQQKASAISWNKTEHAEEKTTEKPMTARNKKQKKPSRNLRDSGLGDGGASC